MLLINNIFRYVRRPTSRQFVKILGFQSNEIFSDYLYHEKKFLKTTQKTILSLQRCYSNQAEEPKKELLLPPLTDEKIVLMPNIFTALRSSYELHCILKPSLDSEFSMPDFVDASKQAAVAVSNLLSREDYEGLEGLVVPDEIQKLRHTISRLSEVQKELIPIVKEDIYAFFPYEIKVVNGEEGGNPKKCARISEVFYILHGLKELHDKGIEPPLMMGMIPEYQDKVYVCNIQLERDYLAGAESSWIVNKFNLFALLGLEP